jgi:hypothetical protein
VADLITRQQLADALQQTVDNSTADLALAAASAAVRSFCRQEITSTTWTAVRLPVDYDSDGWFIRLPQRPVVSVASVSVNGAAVSSPSVDYLRNRIALPDGLPADADDGIADSAVVTYTSGVSDVPDLIVGIALAVAMRMYDNPTGLRSETLGAYSATRAGADDDVASGGILTPAEQKALRAAGYRPGARTVRLG